MFACPMTGEFERRLHLWQANLLTEQRYLRQKEALDRFKMEVANELGVPLSNGYNGNLTHQNGFRALYG